MVIIRGESILLSVLLSPVVGCVFLCTRVCVPHWTEFPKGGSWVVFMYTPLWLLIHHLLSQDECSPNVDSDFSGGEITGGIHLPSCLFQHCLNDSVFFHVDYRIHPERYIK